MLLSSDIVAFYCTNIRPVSKYCAPVYHHEIPQYLSDVIKRVQNRVLSIPSSSQLSESKCLAKFGLDTLFVRRVSLWSKLFNSITSSAGHNLFSLLSPSNPQRYNFRRRAGLATPRLNTDSLTHTFINSTCAESS